MCPYMKKHYSHLEKVDEIFFFKSMSIKFFYELKITFKNLYSS